MAEWRDFFVAQAGASAALAGLIFVAISISLAELLKFRHLLMRAAVALTLLVSVLVISSLLLAPNQSLRTVGIEILVVSSASWLITTLLGAAGIHKSALPYRHFSWAAAILAQIATVPLVIAGIVVLAEGASGLYWQGSSRRSSSPSPTAGSCWSRRIDSVRETHRKRPPAALSHRGYTGKR